MTYAFDTLGYAKRLREAGIPSEQAEAHAEAAREFVMGELVTRYDLDRSRRETDGSIAVVRQDMVLFQQRVETALGEIRQEIVLFQQRVETALGEMRQEIALFEQRVETALGEMRQEIALFEQRVETALAGLRQELESQRRDTAHALERMTLQMTVRLGGMIAIAVAILATIIKI